METKSWAIGLMVFITFITTCAQLLYKYGVQKIGVPLGDLLGVGVMHTLLTVFLNPWVLVGLVLYAIGAVLLVIAFKGGDVTVLFPIIATSYLWVTIGSYYLFGTSLSVLKIVGVFVLMGGVVLIGTSRPVKASGVAK